MKVFPSDWKPDELTFEFVLKVLERHREEEEAWLAGKGPEQGDPEERAFHGRWEERAFHDGRWSAYVELIGWVKS